MDTIIIAGTILIAALFLGSLVLACMRYDWEYEQGVRENR